MILFHTIFAIIFICFSYVNLNDLDAWLWVTIYLLGTFSCATIIFAIYLPTFYLALIIIYATYALFLFFSKDGVLTWLTKYNMPDIAASMQVDKPWIEKTREFFGLLIVCAVLLVNYLVYV